MSRAYVPAVMYTHQRLPDKRKAGLPFRCPVISIYMLPASEDVSHPSAGGSIRSRYNPQTCSAAEIVMAGEY